MHPFPPEFLFLLKDQISCRENEAQKYNVGENSKIMKDIQSERMSEIRR